MKALFCESHENNLKLIFDFYDFDKDGLISKEDIRVVLSYVPLTCGDIKHQSEKKYFSYLAPNLMIN